MRCNTQMIYVEVRYVILLQAQLDGNVVAGGCAKK